MQPKYEYGSEVRLIRNVRNDGTYPGTDVGQLLMNRGAVGCVYDVGSYLQDQIIYRVHFLEQGKTVGCREEELIPVDAPWIANEFEFNQKVQSRIQIEKEGEVLVEKAQKGTVVKVLRDVDNMKVNYHIYFGERTLQMPEAALESISN